MPKNAVLKKWSEHFSGAPAVFASAPGRVNLIGEHTDYNQGFVFPAAINRRTQGVFRLANSNRLISAQAGAATEIADLAKMPARGWGRFVTACACAIRDAIGSLPPPLEGFLDSTIPSGSGLSSSAAMEACIISAWNQLCDLKLSATQIAEIAWTAETKYLGVSCGKMDQLASCCGKRDHGLFIDTLTLEITPFPIPTDLSLAVLDTGKPRSLAASAYNERVAECGRAAAALGLKSLRDATTDQLESAKKNGLDETAYRRARHVITENARVLQFCDALKESNLNKLGELCRASHESLRNDYNVSSKELDAMARAAWLAPGCVAARLTGAGFGGCCVALIRRGSFKNFENSVRASYGMYGYPEPRFFEVRADSGAFAESV